MLTKAAQYAIRSTLYLASKSSEENRINVNQIAEDLNVPSPFLAKLLQQLSRANLISSIKGPKGGFYFGEENKNNTLWDIIKCIDGGHRFYSCFVGRPICNDENPCAFHEIATEFREKVMNRFNERAIHTLPEEINSYLF